MEAYFDTPRNIPGPCVAAILKRGSRTILILGEVDGAAQSINHGTSVVTHIDNLIKRYAEARETLDLFVNDSSVMLMRNGRPNFAGLNATVLAADGWKQDTTTRVHYIDIRGDGCMLPPTQSPMEVVQRGYPAMVLLEELRGMTQERTAIANLMVIMEKIVYQYASMADTLRRKTPKPAFIRLLTKQLGKITATDRRVLQKVVREAIKTTSDITQNAVEIMGEIAAAGDASRPIAETRQRVLRVYERAVRIATQYYAVYTRMTSLYGLQRLSKPYVRNAIMYTEHPQARFMIGTLAQSMGYDLIAYNEMCLTNRPGFVRLSMRNQGYSPEYDDAQYDIVQGNLRAARKRIQRIGAKSIAAVAASRVVSSTGQAAFPVSCPQVRSTATPM